MNISLNNKIDILTTELQQTLELCRSNNWLCEKDKCATASGWSITELSSTLKRSGITIDELIGHIVETHLLCAKHSLPRFDELFIRAQLISSEPVTELMQTKRLIEEFERVLTAHMLAEETMLFPYIIVMEKAISEDREIPAATFESLENLTEQLITEHKTLSVILGRIRETCNEIQFTNESKGSFIALCNALTTLERELQVHIHLEEKLIYPFASYLEKGVHSSIRGN